MELTEAKLNYMIGETDAVLRSMCLDDADQQPQQATAAVTSNDGATPGRVGVVESSSSPPMSSPLLSTSSDDNNHATSTNVMNHRHDDHQHPHKLMSHHDDDDPDEGEDVVGEDEQEEEETLEELTRMYLESYREQLDRSRRELSERMAMLEKEKERVARLSDARKREMCARKRSAAVKAFRLERERELRSAQLAKIDELKARLDELNGVVHKPPTQPILRGDGVQTSEWVDLGGVHHEIEIG